MKKITLFFSILLFMGSLAVNAQTRTITGTVTSAEDGEPIPGVSIVVQGTTLGTVTDMDGNYSLQVPEDAETLVLSFVGMTPQEVPINGRSTIDVEMQPETIGLEEVVVTAMGIKRSEKALGYAVSTVSGDEITKTRSTDVMGSIAGKVSGVDISMSSSSPGASNAVIIRGMKSLGGSNQPLYVVDGVPIINDATIASDGLNNAFDFGSGNQMVNPDDVASISILKGAAASALYGNRASNGVVLITTKEGQKGEDINIVFNSTVEVSDLLRLPTYQNDYGMGWDGHHTFIENGSWGPKFDGSMRRWGTVYNNSQKMKPYVALEDNVRDFFDYGFKYQNSISLSGGSDRTTYYASLSQVDNDGIIPTDADSFNKYTGSFKGTHEVGKFKISSALNISRQNNQYVLTGQENSVMDNITQIPRDVSIIGLADYETDPFDTPAYYFTPYGVINPYYALDHNMVNFESQKLFGKVQFDYEIIQGLIATYRFGFDATDHYYKIGIPRIQPPEGTPNHGQVAQTGSVDQDMERSRDINQDLIFNYTTDYKKFNFNLIAGLNSFDSKSRRFHGYISNLDIPDFFGLSNTSGTPIIGASDYHKRLIGVYGNAEIAYDETFFLTLTGRNDYTSTLPVDNNSYFYPGVQFSYSFTEMLPESWNNVLSFGKVRVAWGKTGKDAAPYLLDPYFIGSSIYQPYDADINFPLSGQNAYEVSNRLANMALQPEIRTETEFGTRMDFFNGRFGFDITYYNSVSDKQIFNLGLDPSTGYTSQTTNLGEISNKGIELMINVSPVKTKDFQWDIAFNYTKNNEKLVSLPEELGEKVAIGGTGEIGYVLQVGQPLGLFEAEVPRKTAQGQVIVDDDGNPVSAAEKAVIPKAAFDYMMGISNTFAYKGLALSFDFDIRQGGLMYSNTKSTNSFTGNLIETLYNDRRPFVIPNSVVEITDENDNVTYEENTVPINNSTIVNYWAYGAEELAEAFLIPRSYAKLKRVVLAYDLPREWLSRLPLEGVTVSAVGNNLLLWTPPENHYIDPEVTTFGNDLESKYGEFSANPPTRRFGFNLRLVF